MKRIASKIDKTFKSKENFQKLLSKTFFMTPGSIFMNLYHAGLSDLFEEIETASDPLIGISDRINFERIMPIL